jgi:C-terminal processing protease CtpA/Prc
MPLNFTDFDTVGRGSIALEAEPGGVVDAPDILVPPRRVGRGQQAGDLGFETKQTEPGDETPNPPKVVALVRPGGPAAATDLKVGDVIVAVDGHDITGTNTGLYSLAQVTEGTTIELELERGATVRITAGPPL